MSFDCAQFEAILPDLDRAGSQGAALREAAFAHAESCSRCAGLLTESESLDFALHSLAAHDAFRLAPPRVEAALLNRLRLEKGLAARRRLQWRLSVLGAAAAMLLVLGLSLHERDSLRPHSQPSASSVAVADRPVSSTTLTADDDTDAFTPLPYADDPDADGGTIVRVVLSRSALASMGMSAAALEASDQIPVDLIVSQDGTPQAIRLLAQENQNAD